MTRPRSFLALVVSLLVVAGACGGDGGSESAGRTIEVTMRDIAFDPDRLEVKAGETVEFAFKNTGMAEHEAVIGDAEFQEQEEKGGGHSEGHHGGGEKVPRVVLSPGREGKLTYTFDEPGEILIGCHVPAHWTAGMKVTVTVQ